MRSIEMTRHHKSNNVYNILKQIIKSEFLMNKYLMNDLNVGVSQSSFMMME